MKELPTTPGSATSRATHQTIIRVMQVAFSRAAVHQLYLLVIRFLMAAIACLTVFFNNGVWTTAIATVAVVCS